MIFCCADCCDKVLIAQVPYGALVAKGIKGLLMAGIGMDISHDALPPVRLKKNVMRSGEAAAVAACLALRQGLLSGRML